MTERSGDWMQTYTGLRFYPLDPRPQDVCIEDIAHALSQICRFGGHSLRHYSVAQHCVLVSELVPQRLALWGLLHDAAEAYVGDVVLPLKRALRVSTGSLDGIEYLVENAIHERFKLHKLSAPDAALVKHADIVALATERRDVMKPTGHGWDLGEDVEPDDEVIVAWGAIAAEQRFLDRFQALNARRGARS